MDKRSQAPATEDGAAFVLYRTGPSSSSDKAKSKQKIRCKLFHEKRIELAQLDEEELRRENQVFIEMQSMLQNLNWNSYGTEDKKLFVQTLLGLAQKLRGTRTLVGGNTPQTTETK